MTRFAVLVAALAGCYKPTVADCAYQCSASNPCPDELTCDGQLCREPARIGMACSSITGDSGIDAPDAPACAWSYAPSGFDPCMLDPATGPLTITGNTTYDTTTNLIGGIAAGPDILVGGVRILHVTNLTSQMSSRLDVVGMFPLIIAVDNTALISGTINVSATGSDASGPKSGPGGGGCATGTGGNASGTSRNGGGGGGLGTGGGTGGDTGQGTVGGGGQPETGLLVPLRGGCAGGNASNRVASNGFGGGGGGAIQISARNTLTVTGTIQSSGAGGNGGMANATAPGGGGGGGSGGVIVLEADALDASGSVCANGGGGGGGGELNGGQIGQPGDPGTCSPNLQAAGGIGVTDGGVGGAAIANPSAGENGSSNAAGGGGGGVGRIVFTARMKTTAGMVSPAPE
jgi:hypothetical protein